MKRKQHKTHSLMILSYNPNHISKRE